MSKFLVLAAFALTLSVVSPAQKKRVVIMGSSTAAGFGASDTSKAWANLLRDYWGGLGEIDTVINMAIGGLTTYTALPMGYFSPLDPTHSRPSPLPSESVSTALLLNPDVVLVCFASNDIEAGFSKAEYTFNLHVIYNTLIAAGKTCYIASTQPRTEFSPAFQDSLLQVRDSILLEFASFSMDFYSAVVAPDSLTINPLYAFTDGIHLNDAGHQQLFQIAKNDVILSSTPLALSLTSFTAQREQQGVLLRWTDQDESEPTDFEIQRSATGAGSSFETVQLEKGLGAGQSENYSWTDNDPLPGGSFYRLKIDEQAKESYSQVVSVGSAAKGLSFDKIMTNGSQLMAGVSTQNNQ